MVSPVQGGAQLFLSYST
ncbi:hypothetical protein HaLaN_17449 [Haematococcus lacustris]|uniref:Uncharacterized protein n=1 Tax=Haematococcus lacustris TaxID=44745 RepID=A0A699ZWM8_HAELA|nr:hypothetical protein HaLaN_17449 [Haematococcus lacustris]